MPPIVLRDFTLVTALGAGLAPTLAALRSGRSGLAPCGFETAAIPTFVGAVEGIDRPAGLGPFDCRNNRLARLALAQDGFAESVAEARERYGARRIAVLLGTSTSGIHETELAYRRRDPATGALPDGFDFAGSHDTFSVARYVAGSLDLRGPTLAVSTACSTTAKLFGNAQRMLAAGLCDAALVGGADSLCLTTLYGFRSLCLTAEGPCRPFDAARDGLSLGEAAGFALVEREGSDTEPDAIRLLGIGESGDAHHMSTPHPEGLGARLAMERALAAAGLAPGAIDYVNLHGTATRVGDVAEDRAITALFGRATPCSSTKGHTGHTLGAAGIVEAIVTALALRHGLLPGSPHTRAVDPALGSRYLTATETGRVDRAMTNSFGFGGSNCSLVLGRA